MLARELFDKMPKKGCLPNEFSTLLHGYCHKGKLSEANAIVNEMMRNGCVPNTCNILLHSLWKEGKILEAEDVVEMPVHWTDLLNQTAYQ
ncbi:hypothetical protein Gotri_026769 [Gossypium trilobum]|uniref:Pentatricopeptide repeat-containing protein n=1 Tax=Gossypium trilobum TaxID=34281 RepID=A0A7J9FV72_9ROSI|nr:hypothetical protein [Gossypium trilobum]